MKRETTGQGINWKKVALIAPVLLFIALLMCLIVIRSHWDTHFRQGTTINGMDCSNLTQEEAKEKLKTQEVLLNFFDGTTATATWEDLGVYLKTADKLNTFLYEQRPFWSNCQKEFKLFAMDVGMDESKTKEYLSHIPCLQTENMLHAQNAYLTLGEDGFIKIVPEVYGTSINLTDVINTISTEVRSGEVSVDINLPDFNTPSVLQDSPALIEERDELNNILKTVINFTLKDGSVYTLDYDKTAEWLFGDIDDDGFDMSMLTLGQTLETNIASFVNELANQVSEKGTTMDFVTSSGETINLPVAQGHRDELDFDAEVQKIKEELTTGSTITRDPIYRNINLFEVIDSYVEVDIDNQTVYMYKNGERIVETPCVTGNVSNGTVTREGVFYLAYKQTDTYLKGTNSDGSKYSSHVNFWMPFDGGIGLHDASWRSSFGGEIYKTGGSHGCVNLPYDAAKTIYENIMYDMPIIVH